MREMAQKMLKVRGHGKPVGDLTLSIELVSFVFDSLAHKILDGEIFVFPFINGWNI